MENEMYKFGMLAAATVMSAALVLPMNTEWTKIASKARLCRPRAKSRKVLER